MKFLSNPGNSFARRLCMLLAIPLLLQYQSASAQNLPDSAFEKVTITVLKIDDPEKKLKDGQRLLYLYLNGFTTPEQRKFYYHYRDSILSIVTADTSIKADARKKLIQQ